MFKRSLTGSTVPHRPGPRLQQQSPSPSAPGRTPQQLQREFMRGPPDGLAAGLDPVRQGLGRAARRRIRMQCPAITRISLPDTAVLINGISLLETELGNRKTNPIMVVYFHAPPCQEIKDCHRPPDARPEVGPHAMAHFLAVEDRSEHRQHRFYQHARVPGATRTDFQVAGIARLRMETRIRQDNHLTVKLGNQRLKMRVMDIGGGTLPGTDQAPLVQDKTQLAANPCLHRAFGLSPAADK